MCILASFTKKSKKNENFFDTDTWSIHVYIVLAKRRRKSNLESQQKVWEDSIIKATEEKVIQILAKQKAFEDSVKMRVRIYTKKQLLLIKI